MLGHEEAGPTEAGNSSNYTVEVDAPDANDYTAFIDYPGLWTYLSTIPSFDELCRRRGEVQLYGGRLIPVVIA